MEKEFHHESGFVKGFHCPTSTMCQQHILNHADAEPSIKEIPESVLPEKSNHLISII
jgi:hypothetical protein